MQHIAVFAATSYSPTDPQAQASYEALKLRVTSGLAAAPGRQSIDDIGADLAGAQTAMASSGERHQQTYATLTDLLESIRGVPQEEVGAQILALQTSLQASLQTTALLFRISLVNYI